MSGHRPEVADVFRSHGAEFLKAWGSSTSPAQRRLLRAISVCRTAALGGHRRRCNRCGHEEISYNSCRNRHCPKCQGSARARWLDAREKDLLEVPYFHVVFTLPERLSHLACQNKRLLYNLLFRAVAETLLTIAEDPKHLGAAIGFLAVLHTWGQTLNHHPHIHCLVPGGGISPGGDEWIPCPEGFLLPVRVLSRLFRSRFLHHLAAAYNSGNLTLQGTLTPLRDPENWQHLLTALKASDWVVYAKPPFGGPQQVLKYLARYTHRVAISNRRLIALTDGRVSFHWTDYAHGRRKRVMSLAAVEFIRRFLLHVLPTGFMHIRYYGFLANRMRHMKLPLARELLAREPGGHTSPDEVASSKPVNHDNHTCPICKEGRLIIVESLPCHTAALPQPLDSS
jgi:hypothetical protein